MFLKNLFSKKPTVAAAVVPTTCTIRVLAEGLGDKPFPVDFENPASLKEAQALIDDLMRKGTTFFKEQPNGEAGDIVRNPVLHPGDNLLAVPLIHAG